MKRYIAPHMTIVVVEGTRIIAVSGERRMGVSQDDADPTKEILVKGNGQTDIWNEEW